jgi:CheY-like chemotaxis protein
LNDVVQAFALRASAKQIGLLNEVSPEVPDVVRADSLRQRQVITNLLGNALKFTSEGEVSVRVTSDGHAGEGRMLHFVVADTGVGIPIEKQKVIFEAFAQADRSTTRKFGGTGLGLTISSHLVKMLGGSIWVESEPGRGSRFHFTAQVGKGLGEPARPALHAAPHLAQGGASHTGLRILLAEDNFVNQQVVRRMLEKYGHTVTVAGNGREAIERCGLQSSDLILMDVQMPEMDGFEATAILRSKEQGTGRHVPIIAITAHAMKGDEELCLKAGMDGYVAKPIKPAALFAAIEAACPGNDGNTNRA